MNPVHEVSCLWKGEMVFDAEVLGHIITFDDAPEGRSKGPSPKRTLLAALAACTGIDVVSMLQKSRIGFSSFSLRVKGEVAEDFPKIYTDITIVYEFTGTGLESSRAKIERAIMLSEEKYCSVSGMLSKAAKIGWELVLKEDTPSK